MNNKRSRLTLYLQLSVPELDSRISLDPEASGREDAHTFLPQLDHLAQVLCLTSQRQRLAHLNSGK